MSRRRRIAPLVLATAATQASIAVLAPIIVDVAHSLSVSVSAVGQARSVNAAFAVAGALAAGSLIDRFGVRPLMVGGALLLALGAAGSAAASTLVALLVAQGVGGLGVAALLSSGFAGVAVHFDNSERLWAMGYVVAAQAGAWIVGLPVVGVLADLVSWRLSMVVVPGAFALAALVAALGIKPELRRSQAKAERIGLLTFMRTISARRWALAELIAYSAWTAELTYVGAFYINTYALTTTLVGVILATTSFCFAMATLRTVSAARRVGRRRLIVLTAGVVSVLLAIVFNFTPSLIFTLGLFFLVAIGYGLRSTASSALGLAQLPEHPGMMMAARTASAHLGYAIGASMGGLMLAWSGFGALGIALAAGMGLSAYLMTRVRDPEARIDEA